MNELLAPIDGREALRIFREKGIDGVGDIIKRDSEFGEGYNLFRTRFEGQEAVSDEEFINLHYFGSLDSPPVSDPPQQVYKDQKEHFEKTTRRNNLISKINEAMTRGTVRLGDMPSEDQTFAEDILQIGGATAGVMTDIFADVIGEGYQFAEDVSSMATLGLVDKPIAMLGKALSFAITGKTNPLDTKAGQAGVEALTKGIEHYSLWKDRNPRAARNLEAVFDISEFALDVGFAKPVAKGITGTVKEASRIGAMATEGIREPIAQSLKRSAEESIFRALNPTTKPLKMKTAEIAEELLERKFRETFAFSRRGLEEKSIGKLEKAGEALEEAGKLEGKTRTGRIIEALETEKDEFIKGGVVIDQNAIEAIEKVQDVFRQYDVFIDDEVLRGIRQVWDRRISLKKKGRFTIESGEADLMAFQNIATNRIRGILADAHPNIAKLNKEYSFWSDFNEIIHETNLRKTGQQGFAETAVTVIGASGGRSLTQMVLRGLTMRWLFQAVKSPGWKLTSARIKNSIANMISTGNFDGALKIMENTNALQQSFSNEMGTLLEKTRANVSPKMMQQAILSTPEITE